MSGQGATQAIEDASVAATLIAQRHAGGQLDVTSWLEDIAALREQRMRFVMELSLAATDTMLEGADPVEGTRHKADAPFINHLKALYNDVGLPLK
jgi:salicylate hydroxylase